MKIAIFMLCLTCVKSEPFSSTLFRSVFRQRSFGFIGNMERLENCYNGCHQNGSISVELNYFSKKFQTFDHRMVDSYNKLFDQEIVYNLCNTFNTTESCFSSCDEEYKNSARKPYYDIFHFLCSEKKLYQAIPCYKDVFDETEPFCHNNDTCGIMKVELENIASFRNMNDVDKLCAYAICASGCRNSKLVEKCGKEQTDLLYGLARKLFNVVPHAIVETGFHVPESCSSLTRVDD